jgi:hypothetical protein
LSAAGKLILLLITLLLFVSCRPAGLIYTEDGKIECGGDGQAIILTNNASAADPTFIELMAFIIADKTDRKKYIASGPGAFVCADFAEEVHNNAEAAGIRAGWVSLTFEGTKEGHALNAFETSDKGLVYIDCTNSGDTEGKAKDNAGWDAVAYIEIGKKYGVLPVERIISAKYDYYSLEYAYYTDCEQAWQEYETKLKAYNEEVDRFNREAGGRVYIFGSAEERSMTARKEALAKQEKELENLAGQTGDRWLESEYSSYLVKSVNIHW